MKKILNSVFIVFLLGAAQGCSRKVPELPALCRLETYAFNPASVLAGRITAVPAGLLEHFRREDKKTDYSAYEPTVADRVLVMKYLRLLPPVYEKILTERCVGIYFISGLIGNGVTSWVIGPGEKVYFYIVLNPAVFKAGLSETLTGREKSCFIPVKGWDIRVDAGTKYKGLLYALFHEATHGLDYAAGITPCPDDSMPALYAPEVHVSGAFFFKTWAEFSKPRKRNDFHGRDKITFYGLGGGPRLDMKEAVPLYMGLSGSGFVSLYGARSWVEDLADLSTFAVLTGKLGQPYRILVQDPGGMNMLEPMSGRAGARAAAALEYIKELDKRAALK